MFVQHLLHYRSNGVHWISIARRNANGVYETKSITNIRAAQSAFQGTQRVNNESLEKLAEKHSLTNGKWMFYGKTGNEIDQLWRTVADAVIRGTIHTFSAKVSVAKKGNDNHVVCIYNNSFLNKADVFALRDGIRSAGIEKPLKYKANVYTHLGINRYNEWGIYPVLYRGRLYSLYSDMSFTQFKQFLCFQLLSRGICMYSNCCLLLHSLCQLLVSSNMIFSREKKQNKTKLTLALTNLTFQL